MSKKCAVNMLVWGVGFILFATSTNAFGLGICGISFASKFSRRHFLQWFSAAATLGGRGGTLNLPVLTPKQIAVIDELAVFTNDYWGVGTVRNAMRSQRRSMGLATPGTRFSSAGLGSGLSESAQKLVNGYFCGFQGMPLEKLIEVMNLPKPPKEKELDSDTLQKVLSQFENRWKWSDSEAYWNWWPNR
jgi:hypothetical protein